MPGDDIKTILAGIASRGGERPGSANWRNMYRGQAGIAGRGGYVPRAMPVRSTVAPNYANYFAGLGSYGQGPGQVLYTPPAPVAAPAPATVAAPTQPLLANADRGTMLTFGGNDANLPIWAWPGMGNSYGGESGPGDSGGGFARGGSVDGADVHGRAFNQGLIDRPSDGRADNHTVMLRVNSYVIPADVVSALGDGNTMAGSKKLDQLCAQTPAMGHARGGLAHDRKTKVRVSGGEYVVPPEKVAGIGGGDAKRGAMVLDRDIDMIRKRTAAKVSNLPGPRQ
jgi:hypothetical protein